MIWRTAGKADIRYVLDNARPQDWREISGLHSTDNAAAILQDLCEQFPYSISTLALCVDGCRAPIAIVSARITAKRTARLWLMATDDWPRIAPAAARFARKIFAPLVLDENVRRTEALVLADNTPARRFAEWLGAVNETPDGMRQYGASGETVCLYARIAPPGAPVWQKIAR